MKEYTIIYKDNTSKQVEVADQTDLIKQYFDGNEERFKKEVSLLRWNDLTMQFVLDVKSGELSKEIFSADVNPYGWRQGERE